jgi:hypothetical protein
MVFLYMFSLLFVNQFDNLNVEISFINLVEIMIRKDTDRKFLRNPNLNEINLSYFVYLCGVLIEILTASVV